jgi:hypothetical protein
MLQKYGSIHVSWRFRSLSPLPMTSCGELPLQERSTTLTMLDSLHERLGLTVEVDHRFGAIERSIVLHWFFAHIPSFMRNRQ